MLLKRSIGRQKHPFRPFVRQQRSMADIVEKLTDGIKSIGIEKPSKHQKNNKKDKKEGVESANKAPLELDPRPDYFAHRIALFERLKAKQDAEAAGMFKGLTIS